MAMSLPPLVNLTLFVASKCPDAPRCEAFLRPALQTVGELVDLQMGFIGTLNASAPLGVDCLHGPSECVGDAVQLCTQRHFPYTVDIDTDRLGPHLSWSLFLSCTGSFNHTADSAIPSNTNDCLQQLGVPSSTADRIRQCVEGAEGAALLQQAVARTLGECGAHSTEPRRGCKSCTMALESKRVCVLDDGELYNCTGMETPQDWVRAICAAAAAKAPSRPLPLACRVAPPPPGARGWPRVWGHSYASTDAGASAAFAIKYFGAVAVADEQPSCAGAAGRDGASPPREVTVRLPSFADYRGGGLFLRFVSNPRKPGGTHGVAAHVAAVTRLYGNLSDNRGHHWNQQHGQSAVLGGAGLAKPASALGDLGRPPALRPMEAPQSHAACPWRLRGRRQAVPKSLVSLPMTIRNQFFDNHLGFYVGRSDALATALLRDGVPFFSGQSSGVFQSVYVVIPGTGRVVEVLGDYVLTPTLPPSHVRFSSTDQFCSPKRRALGAAPFAPGAAPMALGAAPSALGAAPSAPGAAQFAPGAAPSALGAAPMAPGAAPFAPGAAPSALGAAPLAPGAAARRRTGAALLGADLGVNYRPGDADLNKTTMAGADPEAAVAFAARYLGATPIQQHRGPMADGPCVKLAWAEWPDGHQLHVVDYKSADWVSLDGLRPAVPFNITDLAAYVEVLRRLGADGAHDQYLDYHDVLHVGELAPVRALLLADGVPHLVRGRPAERTCSLYVDVPHNGIAVELRSAQYEPMRAECEARPFDLCAAS